MELKKLEKYSCILGRKVLNLVKYGNSRWKWNERNVGISKVGIV